MSLSFIIATTVLLIALVLDGLEIFWPISVGILVLMTVSWWKHGWLLLHLLWRPDRIVAYLAIGILWVFFKWTRQVEHCIEAGQKLPPTWARSRLNYIGPYFYWPLDIIAYFFSDFLVEVWDTISAMVTESFDRYAQWRFRQRAKPAETDGAHQEKK